MITFITSRENKTVKLVRSLHKKKGREKEGLYFAEGVRLVGEALKYIPDRIRLIFVSDTYAEKNQAALNELSEGEAEVYVVQDKIFAHMCDTQTPQGIGAVIEVPGPERKPYSEYEYILILDGVSEPGNMGTIIRTAEAAGIDLICLTAGCTDIYSPKVVRSAMGSLFRTDFRTIDVSHIDEMKKCGFTVAATSLYNSQPIGAVDIRGKRAIVIGSEAHGVSDEVIKRADMSVRLDMCGSVESLNAAVAAGIVMYTLKGRVND